MVLRSLSRKETGRRVRKVWRYSGLTAREFAKKLGEPQDSSLMTRLSQGRANVFERLADIAIAATGEGDLAAKTDREVADYLRGDSDSLDLRVKFPQSGGFTTPDRVKESRGETSKVTEGSGVS